jgi:2-furoyl-CoA dehydrogenase FAD binding subunit
MKPRRFDYVRTDSADEAVAVLAEYGDAANVLAGGQSLMAMLNLRVAEPAVLVDISRLAELDFIRAVDGMIEVGAAVTQNQLKGWPELVGKLPLLAAVLPFVGHFQTRNRGTVCGSIAHADPSSEIPLVLATLGGEVVLRSQRGVRVLAACDFQRGMLTTAREPDELIVAVRFPVQGTRRVAFREVARRHGDFAILAVAACVEDRNTVRIGIGGVANRPAVHRATLDSTAAAKDTFESLARELEGYDDLHASARLRRDLLRRVGPIVVEEALRCAT